MFKEGNYDITEFSMSPNGMNQFVSPDVLPSNFCYSLENIIPSPLGAGQVRYGTSLVANLPTPNVVDPEFNIMKCFPFTKDGNVNQSILYVSRYGLDTTISNIIVESSSKITFDTTFIYEKCTKIKISYKLDNVANILYADIQDILIGAGNTISLILETNFIPVIPGSTLVIEQISSQFGHIYSYNLNTNTLSAALRDDLHVGCVPRCAYFQQSMIICNGKDNVMTWDGTNLKDVTDFLIEAGTTNFDRIDAHNFNFNCSASFDVLNYGIGDTIKLRVNGTYYSLTVSAVDKVDNVVAITTIETLPVFTGADEVVLFYSKTPPEFSYIYVANDRIWALGPGAVGLEYRDTEEQLKVYYSYRPDSVSGIGWFNETTKTVPSINMSDKHAIQDNFEAICQVNGLMAFIGRKNTQIWSGNTPTDIGNFSWHSNIPIGILHGDLLLEISNDVYFVSQFGINSFSTLNIAAQLSANSSNSVDPIVKKFSADATSSNSNYRSCSSFKYKEGGIAGFKISNNKILASLFSTSMYSWFYLSGDFSVSNCFMEIGSSLYMGIGNRIYKYADGSDGSARLYGDQGGNSSISVTWTPGIVKFRGRKGYSNKRYELVANYPSSFNLNKENIVEISIFGDIPRSFSLSDTCSFQYRGDILGQEPLAKQTNIPNEIGFRLRKEYEIVNKRLKFTSSSFWLSLSGYVKNGPVTFRTIRLFGIGEKNA